MCNRSEQNWPDTEVIIIDDVQLGSCAVCDQRAMGYYSLCCAAEVIKPGAEPIDEQARRLR